MKKGVVSLLSLAAGTVVGAVSVGRLFGERVVSNKRMADKHLSLYLLMNQWVRIKQKNKSIADYLESKGYQEIAIYGMNYVGETLLRELDGTNIKVLYGIDKNADSVYSEIELIAPEEELRKVDAVIVTPISFFDEIEELLSGRMDCPILSIEDILYEV